MNFVFPCFGKSLILFKQQWKHRHCELDEYTRGRKKRELFFLLVVIHARPLRQGLGTTQHSRNWLTTTIVVAELWRRRTSHWSGYLNGEQEGRRGIKTENYFFCSVWFEINFYCSWALASAGRGWNSRSVGFSFRFSACIFYYTLSGSSLSWRWWRREMKGNERAFSLPIVGRFLNGRAEQQQRWNCVDGELNSYEGCQMNEFFFASSALRPLLTPPSLVVVVAFFFIIVIAFMLLREKSASTTLNVNEGERAQAESSFIFTSTLTASLQSLFRPPNKSHLPALLLCRMSFFFSRCCCCLRVCWEVVVAVLYVLSSFFMYFKERAAKARKCFLCRSLLSTIFRCGCGAKFCQKNRVGEQSHPAAIVVVVVF